MYDPDKQLIDSVFLFISEPLQHKFNLTFPYKEARKTLPQSDILT